MVEEKIKPQDFEHPKPENLSYDKYIVGAWHSPETTWEGMNFIYNDGSTTGLPTNKNHVESRFKNWQEVRLIKLSGCSNSELKGLEFLDKDNKVVHILGHPDASKSMEIPIAEGERLIGIKSLRRDKGNCRQDDLQFIIGSLI